MLKSVAELEGLENEMTRKDYELAYQLKQYKEGRFDKQQELRFKDKWEKEGNDAKIRATQISAGAQIRSAQISADASRDSSRNYRATTAFNMLGTVRERAEDAVIARLGGANAELMRMNPRTLPSYNALVQAEQNRMIDAIAGDDPKLARQLRTIQGTGSNDGGSGGNGGATLPWERNFGPAAR